MKKRLVLLITVCTAMLTGCASSTYEISINNDATLNVQYSFKNDYGDNETAKIVAEGLKQAYLDAGYKDDSSSDTMNFSKKNVFYSEDRFADVYGFKPDPLYYILQDIKNEQGFLKNVIKINAKVDLTDFNTTALNIINGYNEKKFDEEHNIPTSDSEKKKNLLERIKEKTLGESESKSSGSKSSESKSSESKSSESSSANNSAASSGTASQSSNSTTPYPSFQKQDKLTDEQIQAISKLSVKIVIKTAGGKILSTNSKKITANNTTAQWDITPGKETDIQFSCTTGFNKSYAGTVTVLVIGVVGAVTLMILLFVLYKMHKASGGKQQ